MIKASLYHQSSNLNTSVLAQAGSPLVARDILGLLTGLNKAMSRLSVLLLALGLAMPSCSAVSPCDTAPPGPGPTVAPSPCTIVPPKTCATYTCPPPWMQREKPNMLACPPGGCTTPHCCLHPTTTPCPTTTAPTCMDFVCPAAWIKRPQAYNLQCYGTCTAQRPMRKSTVASRRRTKQGR